jgi:endoglucanase
VDENSRQFLRDLLRTPSPSGYEQPIQKVVRQYIEPFADEVRIDVHGNLIAARNTAAPLRLMLAGHCDQIGMIVSQIDDAGFLYAQTIGGWDPQQLVGQRMKVWTDRGGIPAVISRKPIHLLNDEEKKQVAKIEDMWLDIGARSKAEAAEFVRIGDPVTLEPNYQELQNQLVSAPGMDNRCGLWVVIEAFRRASSRELNCALYAVSTVQEEIGLRGATTSAFGIDPQCAIAVDVTHATDCPTVDKRQQGDLRLNAGPVVFRGPNMNPRVSARLMDLAKANSIEIQLAASGRATPNDANPLQINRQGVATGLVSIPNRYMHSAVETISTADIDRAADLLCHFAASLPADADFTP